MKRVIADPSVSELQREGAARSLRAAEAVDADTKARFEQLLWFSRKRLGEVREDLYFSGQERFGE